MGLDKDDPLIKRRIRQKYDLIAEEGGDGRADRRRPGRPTKAAIRRVVQPPIVSFDQIFSITRAPAGSGRAAKAALTNGASPATLASIDAAEPGREQFDRTGGARFGDDSAKRVGAAPVGQGSAAVRVGFRRSFGQMSARAAALCRRSTGCARRSRASGETAQTVERSGLPQGTRQLRRHH